MHIVTGYSGTSSQENWTVISDRREVKNWILVVSNIGIYIMTPSRVQECNICPKEMFCPEGPTWEFKWRFNHIIDFYYAKPKDTPQFNDAIVIGKKLNNLFLYSKCRSPKICEGKHYIKLFFIESNKWTRRWRIDQDRNNIFR